MSRTSQLFAAQGPLFEPVEPRLLLSGEILTEVDYLIIAGDAFCPADGQHPEGTPCDSVQALADWKRLKGFQTRVVGMSYIESYHEATSLGLREYIADGWFQEGQHHWTTPPKYVLLVGDEADVPSGQATCALSTGVHVTDVPYADTDGDEFPEAAIGRIPVDSIQEANVVIAKILKYDRNPDVPANEDGNWYDDALVAAYFDDLLNPDGQEDSYMMETAMHVYQYLDSALGLEMHDVLTADGPVNLYNASGYPHRLEVVSRFQPFQSGGLDVPSWVRGKTIGGSSSGTQELIAAMNSGVGLVQYVNHGAAAGWLGPAFDIDDISDLENGDKTPVVISRACLTGQFDPGDCFAEELLAKQGGGAVGVIAATDETIPGASDIFTHGLYTAMWPDYDTAHEDIMHDPQQQYVHSMRPAEAINYAGPYLWGAYIDAHMPNYDDVYYTRDAFQWFGDPEMMLRTDAPREVQVTRTPDPYGSTRVFAINATFEDGTAVEGAYVSVVNRSADVYHTETTDANGQATVTLQEADDPEQFSLVVWGYNLKPFILDPQDGGHLSDIPMIIRGTAGPANDSITVSRYDDQHAMITGVQSLYYIPSVGIKQVQFLLDGGNDVLSFDYSNGNPLPSISVFIDGGDGTDTLEVVTIYDHPVEVTLTCGMPGAGSGAIGLVNVENADVDSDYANDVLTVDLANGNPEASIDLEYNGGAGTDSLIILGTSNDDAVTLAGSQVTATGWQINYTNLEAVALALGAGQNGINVTDDVGVLTLNVEGGQGGTYTFSNENQTYRAAGLGDDLTKGVTLALSSAANLTFENSLRLHELELGDGTVAILDDQNNPFKTLIVGSLLIDGPLTAPTARLDLKNGRLDVDYAVDSPFDNIRQWTNAGRAVDAFGTPTWTGNGITSSAAAGNVGEYAVGYFQNKAEGIGGYTSWGGVTVDPTSVLVRFTWAADINLDGRVNDGDASILGAMYDGGATSGHTWQEGDLTGDGLINDADGTILGGLYPRGFLG